ncbi:MAG: anti-sigma factor domain-containing protein [Mycobacteriales bacterium]
MSQAHERYEELAAGHALAALEPGDEAVFLGHLSSCAACQRAVAAHRETAAHLAYAADPVALPDSLLAGIRAGVASSGRGFELPAEQPVSLDAERTRRRGTLPRTWAAVAAAAAMVLSLGVWNAQLRSDQSSTQARAVALRNAVDALEQGQRVPLTDDSGRPVAYAVVHDGRTVSLVVDGLAPNDVRASTYVLWQTGDTGTRPVAAFDVRGNGIDVVRDLPLVTSLKGWKALAVTKEPGRIAPKAPGGLPVANGPLSA